MRYSTCGLLLPSPAFTPLYLAAGKHDSSLSRARDGVVTDTFAGAWWQFTGSPQATHPAIIHYTNNTAKEKRNQWLAPSPNFPLPHLGSPMPPSSVFCHPAVVGERKLIIMLSPFWRATSTSAPLPNLSIPLSWNVIAPLSTGPGRWQLVSCTPFR